LEHCEHHEFESSGNAGFNEVLQNNHVR